VGQENYVADHLSRYAADPEYIKPEYHTPDGTTPDLQDDILSKLVSFNAGKKRYTLLEPRVETALRDIWVSEDQTPNAPTVAKATDVPAGPWKAKTGMHIPALADKEPSRADRTIEDRDSTTSRLLASFMSQAEDERMFDAEQLAAKAELSHWRKYVETFYSTFGRKPVLYDLFCGRDIRAWGHRGWL